MHHQLLFACVFVLFVSQRAAAQFGNIFEQMFGGQAQQQQAQQQSQQAQNVPSDSEWYQRTYNGAHCENYLCPGTLACVHFPHHCPCQWPAQEDKVELAGGSMVCASKGGYKPGEMERKVELARMGLL